MKVESVKRICITLPQALVAEMDEIVPANQRSALVADLLEEYLDALSAEEDRMVRMEMRRQQRQDWLYRIRESGRRAADMFLP